MSVELKKKYDSLTSDLSVLDQEFESEVVSQILEDHVLLTSFFNPQGFGSDL